jgi:hypothetical protein
MNEDDQIEVVIDDTPNKDEPEIEVSDDDLPETDDLEASDEDLSPEKAVKKLEKRLKKEKEARREAERLAREAQHHVAKAYTEVDDTNMHLVSTAIDNLERDLNSMTSAYAEAMQAGEYETAARIQRTMAGSETKLEQLKYGFEEMRKAPPKRALPEAPAPSPKEALNEIIDSVSPASADWLRSNKSFIRDHNDIQDMFSAHNSAVQRGISADTPEYFAFIERRLGIERAQEEEQVMSSASKPVARKAAPPAAPVNRTTSSKNAATLTKAEAEMAQALGMSHKEYWSNQQALKKKASFSNRR